VDSERAKLSEETSHQKPASQKERPSKWLYLGSPEKDARVTFSIEPKRETKIKLNVSEDNR